MEPRDHRDPFASTRWSMVAAAGAGASPQAAAAAAAAALAELCQCYWKPVYGYVRRRTPDEHQARDLTQGFFARVLEKGFFHKADPSRGRFRAFLLTALKNFLINESEKARRQLPAGRSVWSFDFASADSRFSWEPATTETPDRIYDRQWALSLLDNVFVRLRHELAEEGKLAFFESCKGFLSGEDQRPLAEVARDVWRSMSRHVLDRRRPPVGHLEGLVLRQKLNWNLDANGQAPFPILDHVGTRKVGVGPVVSIYMVSIPVVVAIWLVGLRSRADKGSVGVAKRD